MVMVSGSGLRFCCSVPLRGERKVLFLVSSSHSNKLPNHKYSHCFLSILILTKLCCIFYACYTINIDQIKDSVD